jgi:hypothetical protein
LFRKLLVIFFLSLIFVSCSKENDIQKGSVGLPVIRGFQLRNELGDIYGEIGEPDNNIYYPQYSGHFTTGFSILCFPIPNRNYYYNFYTEYNSNINIAIFSSKPVNHAELWIERALYNQTEDNNYYTAGGVYASGNPHIVHIDNIDLTAGYNYTQVGTANIKAGYYRVFVKINNVLLWDNLIINQEK